MKRYQLLSLFLILYCTGQYKCSVFCAKSINAKSLTSIKVQLPSLHSNQDESKTVIRPERQLKSIDFETDVDNSKQERPPRTLLGSKHLKPHDAHQVANYFLAGGPLKGHSHFVSQAANCNSNGADENVVGMSNPSNESKANPIANDDNSNKNSSDSIVGARRVHTPIFPYPTVYKHSSAKSRHLLQAPLHGVIPHIPQPTLLHSVLHPNLHPHLNRLHAIPRTLMRAATLPVHGLLQAQTALHNILPTSPLHRSLHLPLHRPLGLPFHALRNSLLGSVNSLLHGKDIPTGDFLQLNGLYSPVIGAASIGSHSKILSNVIHPNLLGHPQPIGYILKYVAHAKNAPASSPLVGSPQPQASNCLNPSLDTGDNVVGSVNNANSETNKYEDQTEQQSDTACDETA